MLLFVLERAKHTRMRIYQVSTGTMPVLPDATGGVERYVHNLSVALSRMGHETTVIDIPTKAPASFPYRRAEVRGFRPSRPNIVAHVSRGLLFGLGVATKLESLIRRDRPDLVSFHGQFAAAVAMSVVQRHAIPTVFTMHNPLWSDARSCCSFLERTRFWLEWYAEARAECVIGLSHAVTNHRERYFGLLPSKVAVVPVGVDDDWFEPKPVNDQVRQKYAPNGEAVVLQVGRIAPYKNQLALVEAFRRVWTLEPRARLTLVGPVESEPYLRSLQAAAGEMSARGGVIFAGPIPQDQLCELYGLAQIVVLPSLRENCPQAVLEAMAKRRAIVASDIEPLREVVPGDVGILLPPLDVARLADSIIRLLRDPRLRDDLGTRARQRAYEHHRWQIVARRIHAVYRRLLEGLPVQQ